MSTHTIGSPVFSFLGLPSILHATTETTSGKLFLVEHPSIPPGFASPYHTHHNEDEAFYVVDGEVAFVCGGKWLKGGPGTFVYGPKEVPHGFQVIGTSNARLLLMCMPSGFENFMKELADPAGVPLSPPDPGRMMAVAARYGVDIHGPLPELPASFAVGEQGRLEAIDAVRARHIAAMNARDGAAWAGLFTEDAVQMPPNAPGNVGRARIQAWGEGMLAAFTRVRFSLSVLDVHVAGDRAIETGSYDLSMTREGGADVQDAGKYITVYERRQGGWAIARDIWNSDGPIR